MYYRAYERVIVKKAKKYLNLICVKSMVFLNVGIAVHWLWVSVALPPILIGMESIQARLRKCILQVPRSTQNISVEHRLMVQDELAALLGPKSPTPSESPEPFLMTLFP